MWANDVDTPAYAERLATIERDIPGTTVVEGGWLCRRRSFASTTSFGAAFGGTIPVARPASRIERRRGAPAEPLPPTPRRRSDLS